MSADGDEPPPSPGDEGDDRASSGEDDGAPADADAGPTADAMSEGARRKRVLIPVDGSSQSTAALEYALSEYADDVLVLLHVIDPLEAGYTTGPGPPGQGQEWYDHVKEDTEELFDTAREHASGTGTSVETAIELGRPPSCIVAYAEEHDIDHVVMGSHGRSGVSRILLGSVAEMVVRRSPVPVTIVR